MTTERLDRWLTELVERAASDLLLVADVPAAVRREGVVERLSGDRLDSESIEQAVLPALHSNAQQAFRLHGVADASYRIGGVGRFRINLHRERGRAAATIRALPTRVPRLSELNLPASLAALARMKRGLVLVGGPAGSGKTTTVAALIAELNSTQARHVITIEDPVEYEHQHDRSVIEQVEVGIDAPDFPSALRAALRQAPDVIVIGEMRDTETMKIAVAAAETGHLVLSTLHTTDVVSTISRITDSFPIERQNTIRQELAMALSAVITQVLVPSKSGARLPAAELLVVGYGARQHIRRNALQHMHQEITLTKGKGSFTMEESLAGLILEQKIEREEALLYSSHPDDLTNLLASGRLPNNMMVVAQP